MIENPSPALRAAAKREELFTSNAGRADESQMETLVPILFAALCVWFLLSAMTAERAGKLAAMRERVRKAKRSAPSTPA